MSERANRFMLVAIVFGAIAIRILLPLGRVFSGGYLNFIGNDSYYHIELMSKGLDIFPRYFGTVYDWVVVGIAWVIGLGHPSVALLEGVSLFVPPIIAGTVVFMVYLIGKAVFSREAGLAASVIAALLPGEFFSRTLLGVIDHHGAEVLITTFIAFIVIRVITRRRRVWEIAVWAVVLVGAGVLYYYTWLGVASLIVELKKLTIPVAIAESAATTQEAQGLFGSAAIMPKVDAVLFVGGLVPMACAIRGVKGVGKWAVLCWGLAAMVATIIQVRFDYYLAIPLALIIGYGVTRYIGKAKVKKALYVFLLGTFLIIAFPAYRWMATTDMGTPSREWNEALVWMRENTETGVTVVSWWDYGYWIIYRAERAAYVTPSQESEKVKIAARAFLSYDNPAWPDGVDYLMIDSNDVNRYFGAYAIWAGQGSGNELERTLIYRLSTGGAPGYKLVFDDGIKVYEIQARYTEGGQ
jgi:asparagine N-glycosylation enzyme membrane subunit Stt3